MTTTTNNNHDNDIDEHNHQRRRSSFFGRARMSFFRSGGERGATVPNIRGTQGSNFEGIGKVTRGSPTFCSCFGGSTSVRQKEQYLLIKGPFCFVYTNVDAPSPQYAIGLHSLQAIVKDSTSSSGWTMVLLQSSLGDIEYEVSFPTKEIAIQFQLAVHTESSSAQVQEVRKRLGHENLITKRSSLVYAETIAKRKISDQPAAPVSSSDIIQAMPQSGL